MGPGSRVPTSAACVAGLSRRIGILAEGEGQEIVDESALSAAGRPVNEQRETQAVAAHCGAAHPLGRRLSDAEEARRARLDHAVEYRFGADAGSARE